MRAPVRFLALAAGVAAALAFGAAPALADSPWWHLTSEPRPTYLPPGGSGQIVVLATNLGDASTGGTSAPVQIADTLPAGLKAVSVKAYAQEYERTPVECQSSSVPIRCSFPGSLPPYDGIEVVIGVEVLADAASGEVNQARISGGGAPSAAVSDAITVDSQPAPFGLEDNELAIEGADGAPETQAGSHPFQVTSTLVLNQKLQANLNNELLSAPVALPKDLNVKLPAGLVGNPTPFPRCTLGQFLQHLPGGNACAEQTAVGIASIAVFEPDLGILSGSVPVFNLEPGYGEPARFGFYVASSETPVYLDTSVRSGSGEDYGITVSSLNTTQIAALVSSEVTFWGVPGDPRHDNARGWGCLEVTHKNRFISFPCVPSTEKHPPALLISPTSCTGAPLQSSTVLDSWAAPMDLLTVPVTSPLPTLDGCNHLAFSPTIQAEPTTDRASAPSGLEFNLNFHDEGLTSAEGNAQSQLKNIAVTLPEGLTINPSAGVGLGGCTAADYARETLNSAPGAGCPNDSELGTVEIQTPLLTTAIHGSIFIAQPYENPFGSLVALYVVAKNPETGVLVKLPGEVVPNPATGQLETIFENNPQLPFDRFNFHFREGQQAPLVSPPTCGTYTTQAALTPWSEPTATLTDTSSFTVTKGYEGGECPSGGVPPFAPHIEAGTVNNNAGAFSPLYVHLSRSDGDAEISGFSTNMPRGLTGYLTGIPFCPEADIEAARHKTGAEEEANPSCPAATEIGHSLVGTGVGAVLADVPGKIYFAGPFDGASFSVVSVTSAVVGPFDLGTVVLRFGLNINPYTAQVSVSPTSSEPIPTIIKGIVTHVRDIRVYIDRPKFIINPTNCDPLTIGSTMESSLGQRVTVTSPFQNASCGNLSFSPKFAVSTSGKTSRASGASLSVKLTYPLGAVGTYANIAKVKVDLPKQLPSRLTTLQKACTAAQFEANPAGCPPASFIGHAKAVTPLLPVPLEGPAIFVSHGGEAFPSLIMVLQGYGVTIDLVGSTNISKAGITSSTFKTVPDQPVGSFELTLPEGKYSALAANGNLCTSKLTMPTEFVAQNGLKINESTKIAVTSCAKTKALTRAQKLKAALKVCHKQKGGSRLGCEKAARKKYGALKKKARKK
jgi:hypothetical protein